MGASGRVYIGQQSSILRVKCVSHVVSLELTQVAVKIVQTSKFGRESQRALVMVMKISVAKFTDVTGTRNDVVWSEINMNRPFETRSIFPV